MNYGNYWDSPSFSQRVSSTKFCFPKKMALENFPLLPGRVRKGKTSPSSIVIFTASVLVVCLFLVNSRFDRPQASPQLVSIQNGDSVSNEQKVNNAYLQPHYYYWYTPILYLTVLCCHDSDKVLLCPIVADSPPRLNCTTESNQRTESPFKTSCQYPFFSASTRP